jgi:hypothetical protein
VSLKPGIASLRAHDVHQGLQAAGIDRGSGLVGHELEATQTIGMAAALATAVKGLDVIDQGHELKVVAEQQLDIPTYAFDKVVRVLEDAEYFRNVERNSAGKIVRLYENVPEDFARLYATLDQVYEQQGPGEIEQALLGVIDDLSRGPRRLEQLEIDPDARAGILDVAAAAEAIRVVSAGDAAIAYSPYFAYENPEKIGLTLATMDVDRVRTEFEQVRHYQGTPISDDPTGDTLRGLVGAGLMASPAVASPGGLLQPFAVAPYGLEPALLTIRKPILDKALAILAAVRMGQHYGGATRLTHPEAILRALLAGRTVARHGSTHRQYSVLYQMGIVRFDTSQTFRAIQLIDTKDNCEAVNTAIDLLVHGEAIKTKESGVGSVLAPDPNGNYRSPIQTVKAARKRSPLPEQHVGMLWEKLMGHRPLV